MRIALYVATIVALAAAPSAVRAGGGDKSTSDKDKDKDKATTLSGCLSTTGDSNVYRLKTKEKEVEVRGTDSLKEHVGHEVKLTGQWMAGTSATIGSPSEGKETARTDGGIGRHFMVSNIEHVATTCTTTK
jgi:hypothetical protein